VENIKIFIMRIPFLSSRNLKKRTSGGAALIIVVIFFLVISIILVVGSVGPTIRTARAAKNMLHSTASYYLAEAGSEDAYYRIKNGMQISPMEVITLGGSSVTTDIVDAGSNNKEVTSEGNIDTHVRRIKIDVSTSANGVSFAYGAQVGQGGMKLEDNASVEGAAGTVGNVYSNGPIDGEHNSTITGDAIVASGITEDVQARSTVCNTDQNVGKNSPEVDFAQSFVPSDTKPLSKISLYIKKVGSPGSRKVRIVADNGGSPDTSELAHGTLNKHLVGSSYGWVDVTFSDPATLTAGQTYWIVLDAKEKSSKYWVWCKDNNNGFGNGVAKYKSDWNGGGSWSAPITGDLAFKTYLGEGISSLDSVSVGGTAKANSIVNSTITGDAYYQSISGSTVLGNSYPGSPDPPVLNLPVSDSNITDWKNDATAGGVISGNCPGAAGCGNTMGPVKIDGNLTVGNGETLTVTGTIYITGNVDVSNNATISCAAAYGSDSCVIVADGWAYFYNNVTMSGSGDPDSYLLFLSTVEGCNGGAQLPQCGNGNSGIRVRNNVTGAILYTSDSMIDIENNVQITSAVGYKIKLENNAVIKYEIGVADLSFSSGPGGGWKLDNWREVE